MMYMYMGKQINLKQTLRTLLAIVALTAMGWPNLSVAEAGFDAGIMAARRDAIPEPLAQQGGNLSSGVTADLPAVRTGLASSQVASGAFPPTSVWTLPTPAYKISITADDVYQLTYGDLQLAGLPVDTLDPRTFRIFYMGQEAAIRVIGEADGHFDSGDAVVFYGRSVDAMYFEGLTPINKYTGTNIYWLTYGGPAGLRMAFKDGSGSGATPEPFSNLVQLEFNLTQASPTYWSALPFQADAEHWYRDWYEPNMAQPRNPYYFAVNNVATGGYTATFTARAVGEFDVAHRVKYYLNGNLILDDTSGVGRAVFQTSVQVPQSYFVESSNPSNALTVELVSPADRISLDWMKFTYYDRYVAEGDRLAFTSAVNGAWRYSITQFSTSDVEVYDVSNMVAPQIITNTSIPGSGPYAVEFGDTTDTRASYVALTPATRQTPVKIEAVVPMTSQYTPGDLLSVAEGADYIIITHRNFLSDALRLAKHRSARYRVKLIDVQAIYDQFNGGLMSAESIHDFLAYAHANWVSPAPSYVVLVGDGSEDLRRYKGLSSTATFIPPYLALVDPSLGETAADNRFVTLVGNDLMPDMHIGRLPVNTTAEAKAMVDKIVAYEDDCQCQPGGWNQNLLFLTDDLEGGGGDFYGYSDKLLYTDYPTNAIRSPLIPPQYTFSRHYLGQTCDLPTPALPNGPNPANECRARSRTLLITPARCLSASWGTRPSQNGLPNGCLTWP